MATAAAATGQVRRADAVRNRSRILRAAEQAFARQGLDASVHEIALQAGVGIGTLYRHFPTKDLLVDATLSMHTRRVFDVGHHALADPDAWNGFCSFLEITASLYASNRALMEYGRDRTLEANPPTGYREMLEISRHVVRRAQAAGSLRRDVRVEDLVALLSPIGYGGPDAPPPRRGAWRRYLAIILDGLHASSAGGGKVAAPARTAARRRT